MYTATRHQLAALDATGDTTTTWDTGNETEVDVARATFNSLKKKGYAIFRAGTDGRKATAMHEFDPTAAKMIAVPAVVGG